MRPNLGRIDDVGGGKTPFDLSVIGKSGAVDNAHFLWPIRDYYLTNPVARASKTMAECSAMMGGAQKSRQNRCASLR